MQNNQNKILDRFVIKKGNRSLEFQAQGNIKSGEDILYLPVKPPESGQDKVDSEIIKAMTYYSPGNGQDLES